MINEYGRQTLKKKKQMASLRAAGGQSEASQQVYTVGESGGALLMWAINGDQGDRWSYANTVLSSSGPFRVAFQAEVGGDVRTDIALDDVSFSTECAVGGAWQWITSPSPPPPAPPGVLSFYFPLMDFSLSLFFFLSLSSFPPKMADCADESKVNLWTRRHGRLDINSARRQAGAGERRGGKAITFLLRFLFTQPFTLSPLSAAARISCQNFPGKSRFSALKSQTESV